MGGSAHPVGLIRKAMHRSSRYTSSVAVVLCIWIIEFLIDDGSKGAAMPIKTKGPYYVEDYDVGTDDFGDSPYADIVVGHPDGFKIIIHIKRPYYDKDSVSIETVNP